MECRLSSKAVRWHPVIVVDPVTVGAIRPAGEAARGIARGSLEPPTVEVDNIPTLANVVFQYPPGQRMITLADAEKASEGHHGVGDLAGNLVDHEIVD